MNKMLRLVLCIGQSFFFFLSFLQCGFFKRASKDQYDAAYHKAEIHVQPSDIDKLSAEA